jgi:hypothetical protein
MYIYKIVTKSIEGPSTQWVCNQDRESVEDTQRRAEDIVDLIEQRKDVLSVHMSRRTLPGI